MPSNPMISPTRKLAAPVTTRPSAPISWSSLGSDCQSTERGVAAAFGIATAKRPAKSSAPVTAIGTAEATAPIRVSSVSIGRLGRGAILPPATIEGDQPRGLGVAVFHHPRACPARVQTIEESREQHRAGAVDAIEMPQVDVDRAAPLQVRRWVLHDPRHRGRMGEVERTARHETPAISIAIDANGDAHEWNTILSPAQDDT